MKEKELLAGILARYFRAYPYVQAVAKTKEALWGDSNLQKAWGRIESLIRQRGFASGEALYFVAIHANLPLDEDSDEEAYRWLNLLLCNLDRERKHITVY